MVVDAAKETLFQLNSFLNLLNHEQYNRSLSLLNGKTLGMHVRHIVEMYETVMNAGDTDVVNYDARKRNQEVETNIAAALKQIDLIDQFLNGQPEDRPILYKANLSIDDLNSSNLKSSLLREIAYNTEHAIHHMAIISIVIGHHFPELMVSPDFGKAYATIRYEKDYMQKCAQ